MCLIDFGLSAKSHAQTSHSLWLSRQKLAFFKWHPSSVGKSQPCKSLVRSSAGDLLRQALFVHLSIMHIILSHHQSLLQFFSYTNCMNRVKVAEGILLAVTFYSVHSLCTLFFSWTSSCSWISCGCSQPRSVRPTQADTILGNSTGLCVHFHRAMVLRIFFKCLEIVNSVLYQPELSVSLQLHRLWYQIAVSGSCPCSNYLFPYVI